ncbi:MAG: hypothetical protein KAT68_18000 [Bacteroidales bacterium]|nr:hypothetical protein [Bacteroidales bacterium]
MSGAISRELALDLIKQPFGSEKELEELKQYTNKKLDLSEQEFIELWNAPN